MALSGLNTFIFPAVLYGLICFGILLFSNTEPQFYYNVTSRLTRMRSPATYGVDYVHNFWVREVAYIEAFPFFLLCIGQASRAEITQTVERIATRWRGLGVRVRVQ
jgi:hypothetical protein